MKSIVDIRERYHLPAGAKILLYVGNVSRNKNQLSACRAFSLLPSELQERLYILFCGNLSSGSEEYVDYLKHHNCRGHLIHCGNVDKSLMASYYSQADAVALFSICEGFGLSLVEGMHFGLPCIASTTIDAYDDLYSPSAVIGVCPDNCSDIARGISSVFANSWDKKAIKAHAERFSAEAMVQNYEKVFSLILSQ